MNSQPKSISAWVDVREAYEEFLDNMVETTKHHTGGAVTVDVRDLEHLISVAKRLKEYDEIIQKNESDLMDSSVKIDLYEMALKDIYDQCDKGYECISVRESNIIQILQRLGLYIFKTLNEDKE